MNTLDAKARHACHQCHMTRKDQGYVFTSYVERYSAPPAGALSQDGATNHLSRSSAGYAAIEKPAAQSRMRKGLAAND